jgi:hypothetical protein
MTVNSRAPAYPDLVSAAFLSICPGLHLLQSEIPEQPHDATH